MFVFSEFTRLPQQLKEKINKEMWDFKGTHLSIMETSHRSPTFAAVNTQTNESIRKYLGVPADYKILLMQGGSQLVWASIPYNLSYNNPKSTLRSFYFISGPRSIKASHEAEKIMGNERVHMTNDEKQSSKEEYLYSYSCLNDFQSGRMLTTLPHVNTKCRVLDASSVLGRYPIQISNFSIVFASAEHSLGIAGCTIVVVHDSLIVANTSIPSMFSYEVMLRTNSIFNTPNCFAVYVLGEYVEYLSSRYKNPENAYIKIQEIYIKVKKELEKEVYELEVASDPHHNSIFSFRLMPKTMTMNIVLIKNKLDQARVMANNGSKLMVHLQLQNTADDIEKLCQQLRPVS